MLRSGNRKGYMRTMEAFLAFIITFTFLVIILNKPAFVEEQAHVDSILENLVVDEDFREGIFEMVGSCSDQNSTLLVANMTREFLEGHQFSLCNKAKPTLPKRNVFVESTMITGNTTHLLDDPIVKLYYWKE